MSKQEQLEKNIEEFLRILNFHGPNFYDTPKRIARMWMKFLEPKETEFRDFPSSSASIVCLDNHIAWGYCPHHLLPVKYTFRIAYAPSNGRVCGISKLARIADTCMSSLALQEDLGILIADMLNKYLKPNGIGVLIKGEHMCMRIRGVESPEAFIKTKTLTGVFEQDPIRKEFMEI